MIGSKGMVAGRPTRGAGLGALSDYSEWSLVGRKYGAYRDVLQTLKRMRDYNPDAALAVWNTLRLGNPGYTVEVFSSQPSAGGEPVADKKGQAIIEDLAARVGQEYGGGLDTLINIFHLTLMTQGAVAAELELSEDLKEVVDYCPVDPRHIDFARDKETKKLMPVVTASGTPKPVNTNQFRYLPLDPDVDDPHGRSPMWSAMETIFFQTELMRDLKAVVHRQGYPRIDVSILEEIVVENTPEHLKAPGREDEFRSWVDGFLADLQTTYNSLQPDDTFIHWDWVKVAYVGPGVGSRAINVEQVTRAIDTMIVAGLKQLPILLGRNEGTTTTHATVQWQIYVAGIEALQRHTKRLLEWMHNTALRVYGRQSYARVTFNAIRKTDREAEARAAQMETNTLVTQVHAGWISNDEAAQKVAGHDAVGMMMFVPVDGGPREIEGQPRGAARTEMNGEIRMLQPLPPDGVADWLWERAKRTGRAYRKWAEDGFAEKMHAYLVPAVRTREHSGGDGDGPGEP